MAHLDVHNSVILDEFWINKMCDVDWIQLYQDRVQCQAILNTVMNFRVP
jgi:hypothetical protein